MLEKVRCNLCNSSYDSLKYIKNDFRIVRCRCGLVYVNPRKEIEYDKNFTWYQIFKEQELTKKEYKKVNNLINEK